MRLVVDANILFAALIKDGLTRSIILHDHVVLFASEFLFEEFIIYEQEILRKTHRSSQELHELCSALQAMMSILNVKEYSAFIPVAEEISPDADDVHYFALALKLRCPIWSNDKRLKNQNTVSVYSTEELAGMLGIV